MNKRILGAILATVLALALTSSRLQAQSTYTWTGGAGAQSWATHGNWANNNFPGTNFTSGNFIFDAANVTAGTGASAFTLGTATASSLTFAGNGTTNFALTINLNNSLTVNGAITVNSGDHSVTGSGAFALGANAAFNIASGSSFTVLAVPLSGTGPLTKTGAGTLTIQSASTYTGHTNVNGGSLVLSAAGAVNSGSGVSIANGATFTNNSTVAFSGSLALAEGAVLGGTGVSGAEFAPASVAIAADLSDGFTTFALGTTGLTKAGALDFTLSGTGVGTYVIFSGSGLSGLFTTLSIGGNELASLGGGDFSGLVGGLDYTFTNATNTLTVTPEPSTWALLFGGLAALTVCRRKTAGRPIRWPSCR